MSRRLKLHSIVLSVALFGSTIGAALPAYAAGPPATASVDVAEVLAGEQTPFVFSVTNAGATASPLPVPPSEPGATINWIRVWPQNTGDFTIEAADAAGWTPKLRDTDGDSVIDAVDFEGGSLAAGDSIDLNVLATAVPPAADQVANWSVRVSEDDGLNTGAATAAGNLSTVIRVLEVTQSLVSAPAGVLDGTATADQDGLAVTTAVTNHGSQALNVDPSLVSNGNDTITDQGADSIASGGSRSFTFPVDLGSSTTTRTFLADATAPGADARQLDSAPLIAETPAAFAFVGGTLSPTAAVSGSAQTFTLSVAKANPPAVTFDLANSVLEFTKGADSFSTTLASPATTARDGENLGLSFQSITIPGSPSGRDLDGRYNLELTLEGVDDNGAAVSRVVSISDTFDIDNLMPFVNPILEGPAGQITRSGVSAAKTGDLLTFSGEIKQGAATADPPDPSAQIASCEVVVTDEDGLVVERQVVALSSCANNGGQISGSTTLASTIESGFAFLEVVVSDAAGNTTPVTRSTEFVLIDNLAPVFDRALTGCGATAGTCDPNTTIRLFLSEPVKAPISPVSAPAQTPSQLKGIADTVTSRATPPLFSPTDFAVSGNQVTGVVTSCAADGWCDGVTLTVAQAFGDDDNPDVDYAFTEIPGRSRAQDAVTLELGDQLIQTIDGIVPDLPTLATVTQDGVDATGAPVQNERGLQDGAFFTNQELPTFNIQGLGLAYTGIVAIDSDANGDYDPLADNAIAACVSESDAVACQTDPEDAFLADGAYALVVASRDEQGNLSEGRTGALAGKNGVPVTLNIDNAAPTAADFSAAGVSDIAVSFSEVLGSGANAAADWFARRALPNDKFERFDVGAVSGTGDARTLTIDDTDYAPGVAEQVLYTFGRSDASQRYQDRAGNYLGNFILVGGL